MSVKKKDNAKAEEELPSLCHSCMEARIVIKLNRRNILDTILTPSALMRHRAISGWKQIYCRKDLWYTNGDTYEPRVYKSMVVNRPTFFQGRGCREFVRDEGSEEE